MAQIVTTPALMRTAEWMDLMKPGADPAGLLEAASLTGKARAAKALECLRTSGADRDVVPGLLGVVVDSNWEIIDERAPRATVGRPARELPTDSWAALLADDLGITEGRLYRQLREQAGLKISEVVAALGVERTRAYRWENGLSVPTEDDHVGLLALLEPTLTDDQRARIARRRAAVAA